MLPRLDHGEVLFHYTTREAALEHIVPDRQLRLSPYSAMRDPLENKWLFHCSYSVPDDMPDSDPEHPERTAELIKREAAAIREGAKVLSLTLDAEAFGRGAELFGRGWARARMWEQYAENHAGVCLVFDRQSVIEEVTASLNAQGMPAPYNRLVEYTERGTGAGLPLNLNEIGEVDPQWVRELVEKRKDELFFLKTTDWETEREYRFVVTSDKPGHVLAHTGEALKAVVVGERFPRWGWPGVIESCRESGLMALRREWSTGAPRAWWLDDPPDQG